MIIFIFIFLIIILIAYKFKNKIKIKWHTFFRRGFRPNRGIFGVYCYCGKQGQGKTYSVVEFLHSNKDLPIYCNLTSIKGIDYTYIANFEELLSLTNKTDCIIVYDEIFSALQKNSTINKEVLDFLSQMRKRRIICLTTAQEWAEIPLTWRRYCRYQIDCRLIRIPFINGILIKTFKDAENMKWSNDDMEHIAPILETTITHTQKWIANSYDTYEQIKNDNTKKGLYNISQPLEPEVVEPPALKVSEVVTPEEEIETLDLDEKIDKEFWSDFRKEDYS